MRNAPVEEPKVIEEPIELDIPKARPIVVEEPVSVTAEVDLSTPIVEETKPKEIETFDDGDDPFTRAARAMGIGNHT